MIEEARSTSHPHPQYPLTQHSDDFPRPLVNQARGLLRSGRVLRFFVCILGNDVCASCVSGTVAAFAGLQANQYLKANADGTYPSYTNMSWNDSMDNMINPMREVALRTSIATASNTSLAGSVQSVPYKHTSTQIVYVTNYHYTIITAAVSFLGVVAVIPTFWGWWEDGRKVSKSPLEIAKAFDAPLLSITDGNATANEIISQMSERRIKYGELVPIGRHEIDGFTRRRAKSAFCGAGSVMRPGNGKTYS